MHPVTKLFDFNDISRPWSLSPLQKSGLCNSFYSIGCFKNVYDDDDDNGYFAVYLVHCVPKMWKLSRCNFDESKRFRQFLTDMLPINKQSKDTC